MKIINKILFIKVVVKFCPSPLKSVIHMNSPHLISRDVFQKRTMTKSGSWLAVIGKLQSNKNEKKSVRKDYSKQIFRKWQPDIFQKKSKKLLSLTMKMLARTLPLTMLISIWIAFKITFTPTNPLSLRVSKMISSSSKRNHDFLVKNESLREKMISVLLKLRDLILRWW